MTGNAPIRLELTWPNKDKFLLVPKDETGKPIWVERDHPAASEVRLIDIAGSFGKVNETNPCGDNLMFIGDSLDVLRVLNEVPEYRREYRGKVKLVYIDPPFNTGQTFTHYDDWMDHSTWLSFMRDRLILIKDLLAPDGTVWVHLDDIEHHRMRCLMDEVFGADNFCATVIWEKADSPRMDAANFSVRHDLIVVYQGSSASKINRIPMQSTQQTHFKLADESGAPYRLVLLRKTGANSLRSDRPSMWYPLTAPDGVSIWPVMPDGTEGRWRWGQSTMDERAVEIEWVEKDGGWTPYLRQYGQLDATQPPETIWLGADVGFNRTAKAEIKALLPGVVAFGTPKPERLLQRVIQLGSEPGDIVLDCFGGSGTTAAVAHKMGRRWVTAEILADTVATFTQPRLEKVLSNEDEGGITKAAGWVGGGSFRTMMVGPSMYETTPYGVMLADWASNGRFARAVAGQLGFEWQVSEAPLCGVRGRMRLAVLDGAVGPEEVRQIVAALAEKERVAIVAKVVLPNAEEILAEISRGSRVRKAPRDLLTKGARRSRRIGGSTS